MKRVATWAKIQSTREASQHLTLIDNHQTFYLHVFYLYYLHFIHKKFCFYVRVSSLLWSNSKVQGESLAASFDGSLNSVVGRNYF